jgi:hypothetical protein
VRVTRLAQPWGHAAGRNRTAARPAAFPLPYAQRNGGRLDLGPPESAGTRRSPRRRSCRRSRPVTTGRSTATRNCVSAGLCLEWPARRMPGHTRQSTQIKAAHASANDCCILNRVLCRPPMPRERMPGQVDPGHGRSITASPLNVLEVNGAPMSRRISQLYETGRMAGIRS